MNQLFAAVVDTIALAGAKGHCFANAINDFLGPQPDPALVAFLISQLRGRPDLFSSPDFDAPPDKLLVTACQTLRHRALGYDPFEHQNVMPSSLKILEAVGRAGSRGILQSDLPKVVGIPAVSVHHYLHSLNNNRLIAKKRVVTTRERVASRPSKSNAQSTDKNLSHPKPENTNTDDDTEPGVVVSQRPCDLASSTLVTYTSVLMLARFENYLETSNLSNVYASLKPSISNQSPDDGVENPPNPSEDPTVPATNESVTVSIFDMTGDVALRRLIDTLRSFPIRAERDLKMICVPDSEIPSHSCAETFRQFRHRKFRTVRNRLLRLGIIKSVRRTCRTSGGKIIGKLRCMKLTERAREKDAIELILREANHSSGQLKPASSPPDDHGPKASTCIPKKLHPLLVGQKGAAYVAEIDAIEQVYQLLERSGALGISVPEIDAYLDGGTFLTGLPQKRIRNLIKEISRKVELVETQYFEGKTMFVRFSLKKFLSDNGVEKSTEIDPDAKARHLPETPVRRRKAGLTILGEQRQKIVLDLLKEKKVVAYDVLSTDIARVEGNQIARVDRKVMRRIIDALVEKNQAHVIVAAKPSLKSSEKWDPIRLLALPHIQKSGPEVRDFISAAVNRMLSGKSTKSNPTTPIKKKNGRSDSALSKGNSHDVDERNGDGNTEAGSKENGDDNSDEDDECVVDGVNHDEADSGDENEIVDVNFVKEPVKETASGPLSKMCAPSSREHEKSISLDGGSSPTLEAEINFGLSAERQPCEDEISSIPLPKNQPPGLPGNNGNNDSGEDSDEIQPMPRVAENNRERLTGKKRKHMFSQKSSSPTHDKTSTQTAVLDPLEQETVCVETGFRNSRNARIARLRSIDHGLMKGTMARARLFHKLLFKYAFAGSSGCGNQVINEDIDTIKVTSMSIREGKELPRIGRFTIFSYIREMTVEEYAATVGICKNHHGLIETIKKERIDDVLDQMKFDLDSAYSVRRIKVLVQTLSVLGLMEPKDGSLWTLCGAGIIRDFGKGLPPGVEPHAIPFRSRSHVEVYWRMLRKFSQFRLKSSAAECPVMHEVGHQSNEWKLREVYIPAAWFTTVTHEFSMYEQLLFECVLQRLCGVDISPMSLDLSGPDVICSPIRAFTIEEITDELDRVAALNSYIGKRRRYTNISESLLMYARMRVTEEIPQKVRQCEEGVREHLKSVSCAKDVPASQKVSVLKVKRAEGALKTEAVTRALPHLTKMEQRKQGKALMRKKLKIDESPVVTVAANEIVPLLRAIIRHGSIAYCIGDTEISDWRRTVSLWLEKENYFTNDDVTLPHNQYRAITAFCHCMLLRSGFDILSLQLVLRLQELSIRENISLQPLDVERVEALADEVIKSWENLDEIICALMAEVLNEVEHEWRTTIDFQQWLGSDLGGKSAADLRRKVLKNYFFSKYHPGNTDQGLSNLLSVMSTRYRQVANFRMRENVYLGVLLNKDSYKDDLSFDSRLSRDHCDNSMGSNKAALAEPKGGLNRSGEVDMLEATACIEESLPRSEKGRRNTNEIAEPDVPDHNLSRMELAEIVVCAVLRQDRNEQWSVKSRDLLKRFNVESICLARDRLLLSEVVVVLENYDPNRRHLSVAKGERALEPLSFLNEADGEALEKKWVEDLFRTSTENGHCGVSADKTTIYNDARLLTSASAFATSSLTRLLLFGDATYAVNMEPSFEGEGAEGKCIVKLDCERRVHPPIGSGIWTHTGTPTRGKEGTDVSKCEGLSSVISQLLDQSGWQGLTMHEFLTEAEECGVDIVRDGESFFHALSAMVQKKNVCRVAVETSNKEWTVTDGGLFLSSLHGSKIETAQGYISGWTNISGQTDVTLVRESATAILETVMKRPGIDIADAISSVVGRFPWVPRRALADLVFGLVRDGFIRVNTIVRNGMEWVDLDRLNHTRSIDEVSVMSWKCRVKVTLQSVTERIRGGKMWAGTDQHMIELVMPYADK